MRKLLMAAAAAGTLVATVPASAQIYLGADPDGAGVQVGPFGFGVGPRYGWRGDEYYAYGADCPRGQGTRRHTGRACDLPHATRLSLAPTTNMNKA